jgi:hypothetical protein
MNRYVRGKGGSTDRLLLGYLLLVLILISIRLQLFLLFIMV